MDFRELSVPGAWEVTPQQHADSRGVFFEAFSEPEFVAAVGHSLNVRQVNTSVSAAGTIRGIHFADVPPSQAKYVMCGQGAVLDVIVDIRVGSPTFGAWDSVLLDDVDRRAVYISEGLGHAFFSLADDSTVIYLCSATYSPAREHGLDPFDPALGITWPAAGRNGEPVEPLLSDKDRTAPTLAEAQRAGLLPTWADTLAYRRSLEEI